MEQGVTGIASGLATTGLIPVFAAIAPFVTSRSYEMVRNDLGYMRQNAKIVGRNGGFTYSDLGATHHSLEDFAIMRMIPGLVVFAPSDPGEIRSCVAAMIEHVGPTYLRIGAQGCRISSPRNRSKIGKGSPPASGLRCHHRHHRIRVNPDRPGGRGSGGQRHLGRPDRCSDPVASGRRLDLRVCGSNRGCGQCRGALRHRWPGGALAELLCARTTHQDGNADRRPARLPALRAVPRASWPTRASTPTGIARTSAGVPLPRMSFAYSDDGPSSPADGGPFSACGLSLSTDGSQAMDRV